MRGPQYAPDYTFHEQGHSYFFPKFGGESESTVNLLYMPVLNQKFGESMDSAFKRSFSTYNSNIPAAGFKDNVAVLWMTSFNFSPRKVPMADWEKSYQHQGHAKFVDIAQLYGWGALNNFWYYYNLNDSNNVAVPKDNDSLMVKLCETSGADVRPLLHFWGVPPGNAANVASQVAGLGLTPPVEIYDLLMHYKSRLPTDNATYRAFCQLYYGRQPTMNGYGVEREHARQWSTTLQNGTDTQVRFPTEIYDEAAYTAVASRVQEIIDLYYPAGRPPSNNARLADLQPSLGTLSPGFNGTTFGYSTFVPYSATSMTLTPVASDPSASITVNGTPVASGAASPSIDVSAATTLVNVVVVSSDTTVTNTYTVTVTHAPASTNADLTNLVSSAGTLSPAFAGATTAYSATVPFAVSGLTLTPNAAHPGATITVNGSPVASGSASAPIPLTVGFNIINTVVVAEDPGSTKTYVLTIRRTADAGLAGLATSAGTLSPAFNTTTFGYTATVPFAITGMTVTPTASDASAVITVNGSAVATGTPSAAIPLIVGSNVITTVVVSQDLSATNTYTLTVTRVAPGSRWWDGGTTDLAGNGNAASTGGAGTWDTTIQNWDQGSGLARTAWYNLNDDTAVFAGTAGTVTLGAPVSASGLRFDTAGYAINGGTLTLASPATVTANADAAIDATIAGTNGLTKSGSGTLTLSGTNTYTGGTVINAGKVTISSAANLGGTGANLTFNGTGAYAQGYGSVVSLGELAINGPGTTATLNGGSGSTNSLTFTGPVSGNGTLTVTSASGGYSTSFYLNSTSNTFTGPIVIGSGKDTFMTVNSLADTSGAGSIKLGATTIPGSFAYGTTGTAAIAPLTLNYRQIQMAGTTGGATLANNSTTQAITVNTHLGITGTGAKTLTLSSVAGPTNVWGGNIVNGTGSTISLTKSGGGIWVLSGANTYTGKTTVSAGLLSINSIQDAGSSTDNALGKPAAGAGSVIDLANTGTLKYTGNGHSSNRVINLTTTAGGTFTLDASGASGTLALTGGVTSAGTSSTSTLVLTGTGLGSESGVIANGTSTNVAAVTKSGTGTWTISNANTYTGATAVQGGTLVAGANAPSASSGAFGNAATEVNLGVAGGNNDAGILIGGAFGVGRNIRLLTNNTTDTGTRILTLGGNTADASEFSGNIILGTNSQAGRGLTLTAAPGGQVTFSGVIQNPTSMDATTYTVTKAGDGTVVLSNNNTYTGSTTVSAGRLLVNGSTAAGALTVNSNATLGGTGTIGGHTTVAAGGKLEFNISTAPGGHNKLDLAATKSLTFSGASTLTITSTGGAATGDYTLLTAPGGISLTNSTLPTLVLPSGWAATVSKVGNDLVLNVTSTGQTLYQTWSGGAAFDADSNNDGLANGMAWLLGAADKDANALGGLPVARRDAAGLVFEFTCLKAAGRGTAVLKLQYSRDLGVADAWSLHEATVPGDAGGTDNGVVFTTSAHADPRLIRIQATIPAAAAAPGGSLFGRLMAGQ